MSAIPQATIALYCASRTAVVVGTSLPWVRAKILRRVSVPAARDVP